MFGSFGIDIALNSTMSGIVRLCKMKGEPVMVYSGTTRKHTEVHFLVCIVTSLCKAIPIRICHELSYMISFSLTECPPEGFSIYTFYDVDVFQFKWRPGVGRKF
ncbi:hypothetical protein EB796_007575 [Bugula neritina]|uniref:Uncharacterized protein n=1 Tax=Bugula neritina TaxID=10212 RepID=A0A7J7K7D3_BUGNE|nr:hypothetical protein EB796_007575 [Bugula neritina]